MPLISRWYLRTALGYLLLGMAFLALTLANQGLHLNDWIWAFQPIAYHLLAVGWILQLIIGVAYWMFPIAAGSRVRSSERLLWVAYICLNGGLVLRLIAEPLQALAPSQASSIALVLSGLLQAVAAWMMLVALWPRIRARGGPS